MNSKCKVQYLTFFFQIKSEFADIMRKEIGMNQQEWLAISRINPRPRDWDGATGDQGQGTKGQRRRADADELRKSQFQLKFNNRQSLNKLFFTSNLNEQCRNQNRELTRY